MGISFRFNDKSKAELEELAKEVERENATMTEEERAAEKIRLDNEFEKLLEKAQTNIEEKQKRIDGQKVQAFRELSKLAVAVAGILELNIEIKDSDNGLYGMIHITADDIMIVKESPIEAKKGFAALIGAATETMIFNKNNCIEIRLSYDFY